MTAVFSEHKKELDKLDFERVEKRRARDDIASSMTRWRTQWEEEMYAKNAVAAELLTLRSEFEKSSATYDKEIEVTLTRTRTLTRTLTLKLTLILARTRTLTRTLALTLTLTPTRRASSSWSARRRSRP